MWGGLLVLLLIAGVQTSFAQSLGDIARRERDRKQNQPRHSVRVYTNEDLERPIILDPQEQALGVIPDPFLQSPEIEQAEKFSARPHALDMVPLGDVARYYRWAKQLRQKRESEEKVFAAQPQQAPSSPRPQPFDRSTPVRNSRENQPARTPRLPREEDFPKDHRVRVQKGDSLWKLSSRYLGDGSEWRKIAAANPEITNPDHIREGQWLQLPQPAAVRIADQVRVQPGDSLWKLAQARWGDGEAWECIAVANPQILDADHIFAGELLTVPANCTPRT
ncbi:MAG: LysM peptidoglycan-binding domain-containing protein [Acidobacteria bacterium]|nr:LysM peptidoglycan-binding domain-containing protein [Acidobacteriota bacterium]